MVDVGLHGPTQTRLLGGLHVVTVGPGTPAPADAVHVVLCHGYGAPREDLVGLAAELLSPLSPPERARTRFHFPGAPLDAPGGMGGAAWWQLDMARLQALASGTATGSRRKEVPEGAAKARRMLVAALQELMVREKTVWKNVILGGFSQGAMLTTDVTLRAEEPPAALWILSGTLLMEDDWAPRVKARSGLPVLISHGTLDPLLPFAEAEALRDLMQGGGMKVTWVPFRGPHTIAPAGLQAMVTQLRARLAT